MILKKERKKKRGEAGLKLDQKKKPHTDIWRFRES